MNMIAKNCRGLTKLGITESGRGQGVEVKNAVEKIQNLQHSKPNSSFKKLTN